MRNIMQLVSGVAVAGVVAAGSTAFTAGGLATSATPFVGGLVTQAVTSIGTVDTVTFTFSDAARTTISGATVHFATDATDGATVGITSTVTGGSNPTWTCGTVNAGTNVSTCTASFQLTTTDNISGLVISAS
jgi:hypothetical protein